MIVVYCPRPSVGAKELVAWFKNNGVPALRSRNDRYLIHRPSLVVGWGQRLPVPFTKTLNGSAPIGNKFVELAKLGEAGLTVPKVRLNKQEGWLARRIHHRSGNDLLANLNQGDYYVEKVDTTHEFRVHVFKDTGFRTGVKIPKAEQPHPFIRTHLGGWALVYDKEPLSATRVNREPVRATAVQAVAALGYDFGAVDIGWSPTKGPVVFEVNSAPGLEGNTIERYGAKILNFARGES